MAKTTMSLIEQINVSLKDQIIYWVDSLDQLNYGRIVCIDTRGLVVVTQKGLPDNLRNPKLTEDAICCVEIEREMLGVYEPVSLN